MTYFVRSDDGPFDHDAELELDAWRERMILSKNHGQPTKCLYEDIHDPRHPADMAFHVRFLDGDEWLDLTEAEIACRGGQFLAGSQWDFWWED